MECEGEGVNLGNWNETQLNYDFVHRGIHTKIVGYIYDSGKPIQQFNAFGYGQCSYGISIISYKTTA